MKQEAHQWNTFVGPSTLLGTAKIANVADNSLPFTYDQHLVPTNWLPVPQKGASAPNKAAALEDYKKRVDCFFSSKCIGQLQSTG